MKRLIILAVLAVALTGCQGAAEESQRLGEFKVDKLFTKDGCAVYRFADAGYMRYFTNCKGSTEYQSGGKTAHGDGVYGGAE